MKKNLKYRTFEQLLAEVRSDFESYNLEDLIKPHQLIKVAKKVSYDLGLRIQKTKNVVIEIDHGKGKLPDDFQVLNFAYVLGKYKTVTPMIQGTHVEEIPVGAPTYFPGTNTIDICATPPACPTPDPVCPDPCDECQSPEPCGCSTCNCSTWLNCKGETMQLIQKVKFQTREWNEFYKIKITGEPMFFDPNCPNNTWLAKNTAFIRDGYIYASFREGEMYINYQGLLEDNEGNLLVLDHDMINEYYEYAMKERVLEILLGNNEPVSPALIQRIDTKLRMARNNALSIVNTPDFAEMKQVWDMNRKAMFNKYYKMFL